MGLHHYFHYKAKGAIIRSRARWVEDGEKNTSYFFNLEKRQYSKKCISKLRNDNGDIISGNDAIL